MDLVQVYKSMLDTALLYEKDGVVYRPSTMPPTYEDSVPLVIHGIDGDEVDRQLVLPIPKYLRDSDLSKRIIMHPLNEKISKGESVVTEQLRRSMLTRANLTILQLTQSLIAIAKDQSLHDQFTPEQMRLLDVLPNVNDTTENGFRKLITVCTKSGRPSSKQFIDVSLTRSAPADSSGFIYKRASIVKFHLNEITEGLDKTHKEYGFNKKDTEAFTKLMRSIFPGANEKYAYCYGSNSGVAPYMDALYQTFLQIFDALNSWIVPFKNLLVKYHPNLTPIPMEWEDFMANLDDQYAIIRKLPIQMGNDGSMKTEDVLRQQQSIEVNTKDNSQLQLDIHNQPVHQQSQQVHQEPTSAPMSDAQRRINDKYGPVAQQRMQLQQQQRQMTQQPTNAPVSGAKLLNLPPVGGNKPGMMSNNQQAMTMNILGQPVPMNHSGMNGRVSGLFV